VAGFGIVILMGVIGYVDTPAPDWFSVVLGTVVGMSLVTIGILDMRGKHYDDEAF
jgi:hypothetical protein